MKLLVLVLCMFAVACSDAAVERTRPSGASNMEVKETKVDYPSSTLSDEVSTVIEVAEAAVDQVDKVVHHVDDVGKEVKSVEQTSTRVCFGPNNTDCVEVQVKPKFEGTVVPQK